MIEIKSDREIALMEEAGDIVRTILEELKEASKPGIATLCLDEKAAKIIKDFDAKSAFKGYRGFPGNICTSINYQVVHGIPSETKLKSGDILSIDVGIEKNGFFGDAAITIEVGSSVSKKAKNLIEVAKEALRLGIEKAVEGNRLSDVSRAIQQHAESSGYSVVRDFVGHGIGKKLHEDPEIPNYVKPGAYLKLKKGMTLAIEPMINEGSSEIEILGDGWTAVTRDRKLSAHFEHTICVMDKKAKILV